MVEKCLKKTDLDDRNPKILKVFSLFFSLKLFMGVVFKCFLHEQYFSEKKTDENFM